MTRPPYSPDLDLSDYFLFPKITEFIKQCKFSDDKESIMHYKLLAEKPR